MEVDEPTLTFDPRGIRELIFAYDDEFDLAWLHINERRSALTVECDHGICLREDGGEIVGMEVFDFGRAFPRSATLACVALPAIAEIEAFAGRKLNESFEMRVAADALPLTTQMLIFVIGHALATHDAELRAERAGVVDAYLAAS